MTDDSAKAARSMAELRTARVAAELAGDTAEAERLTEQIIELAYDARLKRTIPGDA